MLVLVPAVLLCIVAVTILIAHLNGKNEKVSNKLSEYYWSVNKRFIAYMLIVIRENYDEEDTDTQERGILKGSRTSFLPRTKQFRLDFLEKNDGSVRKRRQTTIPKYSNVGYFLSHQQ